MGIAIKMRLGLVGICLLYLGLASAYALRTPLWQAPDEPAHYNYVKHIAVGKGLPIIDYGDYNHDYLEYLKAAKFPQSEPIDSIRYENHQPPLYYLISSPIYLAAQGLSRPHQVWLLRLVSIAWGVTLLLLAHLTIRRAFPKEPGLALAVPAFIALIPQHTAMSAAVNNDILAEVMVTASLWLALAYLHPLSPVSIHSRDGLIRPIKPVWPLGLVLGLALLTKTTAYSVIIIIFLTLALEWGGSVPPPKAKELIKRMSVVALVAIAISGWWFLRNIYVYGDADLLGLQRHNTVVVGQPKAENFDIREAPYFAATTFRSFWAQLGWMGVPASERWYVGLALLSGLGLLGFAVFLMQCQSRWSSIPLNQRRALILLAMTLVIVSVQLLGYNLWFIQPQGRYLFPAIVPISAFFILGLKAVLSPQYWGLLLVFIYGGLLWFNLYALIDLVPRLY